MNTFYTITRRLSGAAVTYETSWPTHQGLSNIINISRHILTFYFGAAPPLSLHYTCLHTVCSYLLVSINICQSTGLLVLCEHDFCNPTVTSLPLALFVSEIHIHFLISRLTSASLLSSQQYLIGISSCQWKGPRTWNHPVSPGYWMKWFLWCQDECVPMTTMSFCSRGDMKVIQVLWFPNGPKRERESERGKKILERRESRWDTEIENYGVSKWSAANGSGKIISREWEVKKKKKR